MKKFVLAPALAGLAMFVLGALYWMSPLPYNALTPVGDNSAAALALAQVFPTTGTYLIPGPDIKDPAVLTELYQRGPSAEVHFIKEGHAPMEAAVFIKGYLHYFVVALLLAWMIHGLTATHPLRYGAIVKLTALVGITGAVLICLTDPIWWHHPWGWPLAKAVYFVLSAVTAGLVLGRFFSSRATSTIAR